MSTVFRYLRIEVTDSGLVIRLDRKKTVLGPVTGADIGVVQTANGPVEVRIIFPDSTRLNWRIPNWDFRGHRRELQAEVSEFKKLAGPTVFEQAMGIDHQDHPGNHPWVKTDKRIITANREQEKLDALSKALDDLKEGFNETIIADPRFVFSPPDWRNEYLRDVGLALATLEKEISSALATKPAFSVHSRLLKERGRLILMNKLYARVTSGSYTPMEKLREAEGMYQGEKITQTVYGSAAPSDIGEADVDVACRWAEENVPGATVIDVERVSEADGIPVYRIIYEMEERLW